ncbi:uncharacterized protein L201_003822 [Kwoniella dendrophila CBS 6074]|uniref:Tryptophan synthase beta chain-like PALP domain-containing protein n=1 Tax=Kwoniella dendrophila CBS 6074 TaxID=1295534 RepID=A0AAX4JU55_9TREE
MADISTTLPLTPESVHTAFSKIRDHVHRTPLLTSKTLNSIASSSSDSTPSPKFNIYFKCENYQRIGAFKARGAFHAITHLIEVMGLEEVRKRGVVTHSSGNHAQALALAASHFDIPAHIVMPKISTPSKIAGTQSYTKHVYFSGSTSQEREAMVEDVIKDTGAILVPPYDHPDIMLGQGTTALELQEQYNKIREEQDGKPNLKAVLSPLGGGGLLSGISIYFSDQPEVNVIGCEPSYQGGNDGEIGLKSNPPKRIETVKTLTIADGLRTPVGTIPWKIFTSGSSNKTKNLESIYSATEEQIKKAMRLVLERMKVFIEPSSAVPLAVVLYNEEFRKWVYEEQQAEGGKPWDIAIVFSGGNTTIEAIMGIFGDKSNDKDIERAEGIKGSGGKHIAENIAG